jgi:plastocyanin
MRRLVSLTALLAVLAGGCGDDDDEPGRTVTADSGKAVHVVAKEYSFDPETIVLTGGGKLTIELENDGSLAHNMRVLDGATEIGGTPTFTSGQTRSATLSVEPGEYKLECTVGDHASLGMTGKLTVK